MLLCCGYSSEVPQHIYYFFMKIHTLFSREKKKYKHETLRANRSLTWNNLLKYHLGYPIRMILAIFNLHVTPIFPIEFRFNLPLGSEEKGQIDFQENGKNRFSRWRLWRPSWISDPNNFSYFWSTSHQDTLYFLPSFQSTGLLVQEKFKIDFQDGCRCTAILDQNNVSYVWSTSHPDTSYQVLKQLAIPFRGSSK